MNGCVSWCSLCGPVCAMGATKLASQIFTGLPQDEQRTSARPVSQLQTDADSWAFITLGLQSSVGTEHKVTLLRWKCVPTQENSSAFLGGPSIDPLSAAETVFTLYECKCDHCRPVVIRLCLDH
ncbi:hypothetical protein DPX16_4658 [Anabarilius grahami]|uniref:Uncharacterized protein n=1 Tax=Anabarilius grahami TaxID=495550 RepID=A0A3N0Y0L0_ANAGA|nr:hypothetical protein DPX16_4658 [Anabarilius grahami]